jgi:hypothetical protein
MKKWIKVGVLDGYRPLAVYEDGFFCIYNRALYFASFNPRLKPKFLIKIPNISYNFFINIRLFVRLFRIDSFVGKIFDDSLYISLRSKIWKYDISANTIKLDFTIPNGRKLLNFTILNTELRSNHLVFGEYFDNYLDEAVYIWLRDPIKGWIIICTFNPGSIDHIHNIFQDGDDIWILTGDTAYQSGIWKFNIYTSIAEPHLVGEQKFRAAWLTKINHKLLYATDSHLEKNFLYSLCRDNLSSIELCGPLEGSSIYSALSQKYTFFSTAVEAAPPKGLFLLDLFSREISTGSLSEYCVIYAIDDSLRPISFLKEKKDWTPFRFGQFGTFTFPSGVFPEGYLVAFGIAVNNLDNKCIFFREFNLHNEFSFHQEFLKE